VTAWPAAEPGWVSDTSAGDQLATILDATRVLRSALKLGNSTRLRAVTLQAHTPEASALLAEIAEPLRLAARADVVESSSADYRSADYPRADYRSADYRSADYPSGVDGITVAIAV
jgi:hypothetical protein